MERYYPAPVKTKKSTPAPDPVLIQNSDFGSYSGSDKNRRLLPESTPAPWSPLSHSKTCLLDCHDSAATMWKFSVLF